MKKTIKYISAILTSIVLLSGCYELDQFPADKVNSGSFWKDEADAKEGMMGIYAAMKKDEIFSIYYTRDCMSDIGIGLNWGVYGFIEVAQGMSNSTTDLYKSIWQRSYDGIARANTFLTNVSTVDMSDDLKNQYAAEARFMRALYYNELLNLYGGVPLYDETTIIEEEYDNMYKGRSSETEVRDFILKDLENACTYLPKSWDDAGKGRATKGAAYALKGKVLLYDKQYSEAAKAFEEVRNGGYGYALYPDYADLFKPGGDESSEIIFAVQNLGGASTAYGMPVHYIGNRASYGGCINCLVPSVELADMYEYKDGRPFNWDELFPGFTTNNSVKEKVFYATFDDKGQYIAEYPESVDKLRKMYSERDPRMESTLILPYTENLYKGWVNNAKKDCEMVIAPSNPANETYGYCRNAFGHNTYLYRKFTPEYDMDGLIADRFHSPVNFPIIRYADVLLMLAECYNETSNIAGAVELINLVRDRAGIARLNSGPAYLNVTTKEQVFDRIRKERAVEFAAEGLRFYDLKRWGLYVSATNGQKQTDVVGAVLSTKVTEQKNMYWPIPQEERDMNPNLTQNTSW